MGSLTSISDVSDPYFVRSYHSLLVLPIKARESNHTYHREISLPWSEWGSLFLPPPPATTMRIESGETVMRRE